VTTRILAIADEVDEGLYGDKLDRLDPHIVLSCGDLPFDYLEHIVSRLNVPLLYVPSLLLLHFGIIRREERYLERKFGGDYLTYKARVGRYVWLV